VNKTIWNESILSENVKLFRGGKRDFSPQELNDIKLDLLKYKDCLSSTQFFEGSLKEYKVVSCFAENFHDELLTHILTKYNAAIAITVNLSEKKIVLKKNYETCSIDLCALAKLLCDGDCYETYSDLAFGKITEKFLKFTKTLTPCI